MALITIRTSPWGVFAFLEGYDGVISHQLTPADYRGFDPAGPTWTWPKWL